MHAVGAAHARGCVRARAYAYVCVCARAATPRNLWVHVLPSAKVSMYILSMVMRVSPSETLPLLAAGPKGIKERT